MSTDLLLWYFLHNSLATDLIPNSEFCEKFIENDLKIDYGFSSGQGSDLKAFLVIGHNYWKIDINIDHMYMRLISDYSSMSNGFDNYFKMAISGGADTVGLIHVRTES